MTLEQKQRALWITLAALALILSFLSGAVLVAQEQPTENINYERGAIECKEEVVVNHYNFTNVTEIVKEDNRYYEYNYNHNFNLRHTPDCKFKPNKYIVDGISMQPFWEDGDEYYADLAPWEELTPHDIIVYNRNGSLVAHAVHYINDEFATTIGYRIFNKHKVSAEDYIARVCKR